VTAVVIALAITAALLAAALAYRSRPPKALRAPRTARRILVPFTGGSLDRTVLNAAIRIARAEEAVLVPAYLLIVPLEYSEDSPLSNQVGIAMPLLEAVENAALRCGVPVDARIEKGRTPTHALRRLWQVEQFDRVIAPAPTASDNGTGRGGFTPKDLTWILTNAPSETLVLKPAPAEHDDPLPTANGGHRLRRARVLAHS
jgi:nucleotide-binding universal stress UspA family protein